MLNFLRILKLKLIKRLYAQQLVESEVGKGNVFVREHWLEKKLAEIPKGASIIDVGAGELKQKRFCGHLNYTSQDFGQYDGKGDGKGCQMGDWDNNKLDIVSDILTIPRPDAFFDSAICIEVLEHVPDPINSIKEIARLVKPGGKVIITTPFCSITHFSPYYFQNGFSRYFYEHWFSEFNLEIIELAFNGNYFEYLAQELRRLPEMSKKYAHLEISHQERVAVDVSLSLLNKLSQHDRGSSELLCFGLQMVAIKKI